MVVTTVPATMYLNSSTQAISAGDVALSIAKQFDKYNIITYTETIFNLFTNSDKDSDSGMSSRIWPRNFDQHYSQATQGKRANTIVRGVRVDTKGHILNSEGDYVLLKARIEDRDYQYNSTNVLRNKAIKYAYSYKLRSKNGFWLWLFNGDDCEDITGEDYEFYKR